MADLNTRKDNTTTGTLCDMGVDYIMMSDGLAQPLYSRDRTRHPTSNQAGPGNTDQEKSTTFHNTSRSALPPPPAAEGISSRKDPGRVATKTGPMFRRSREPMECRKAARPWHAKNFRNQGIPQARNNYCFGVLWPALAAPPASPNAGRLWHGPCCALVLLPKARICIKFRVHGARKMHQVPDMCQAIDGTSGSPETMYERNTCGPPTHTRNGHGGSMGASKISRASPDTWIHAMKAQLFASEKVAWRPSQKTNISAFAEPAQAAGGACGGLR